MVRRLILLLLVGCGTAPAPEPVFVPPPPPALSAPPAATVDAPEPGPQYPAWTPCPQCNEKRAKLATAESELAEEEARTEAYVKVHCKGTLKAETRVFQGGARVSSPPEKAWICDGRLVDVPETLEEQVLVARIGDLNHWIKLNCKDPGQPPAVGEKRCREP